MRKDVGRFGGTSYTWGCHILPFEEVFLNAVAVGVAIEVGGESLVNFCSGPHPDDPDTAMSVMTAPLPN